MPQAQPTPEIEAIEDPLVRAYARSWERVKQAQEAIAADPARWRKQKRLREAQRAIEAQMDGLDDETAAWVKSKFGPVYRMGAAAGAAEAGAGELVWSAIQQEAVEELAHDLFQDLLKSTKQVRRSTKQLIRAVARDESLGRLIEGGNAAASAKRMREILAEKGIHAVKYANGAKHGLAEYSQMAIRTKTATAYNHGVLSGAPEVKYFEIFDGPFCGLTSHGDPTRANGLVVDRDTALANPISHPNCRRAIGPRPDVETRAQARDASPSTTEAQRRSQIAQDEATAGRQARAATRARRAGPPPSGPRLGPTPPSPSAARAARRAEDRAARRGDLDLAPPSQAAEDLVLPDLPSADPYVGLKSVEQLVAEGLAPEDAAKEFKRLKANAASKASKAKAKLAKGTDAAAGKDPLAKLLREEKASYDKYLSSPTAKHPPNPKILHNGFPSEGGTGGQARWWNRVTTDTPNHIPVHRVVVEGRTVETGIVTRRDGRVYLLETTPGTPVNQAMRDELEDNIKRAQEALADVPVHLRHVQESFAFLKGQNPADPYWAKQHGIPGFRSAATGGKGSTTFWNSKVTAGTVRHEFGHNVDFGYARKQAGTGFGADSQAWKAAAAADQPHSAQFAGATEPYVGNHPLTPGGKGPSKYGGTNLDEDWAESTRLYLNDRQYGSLATTPDGTPIRFVDLFPARAAHLDKVWGYKSDPAVTAWARRAAQKAAAEKAAQEAAAAAAKAAQDALPSLAEMKKSLPANVKASIASKKSTSKKALSTNYSGAELDELVAKIERAEIESRWRALNGSAAKGAQRSVGPVGPDHLDAAGFTERERAAASKFLGRSGERGSKQLFDKAARAKDQIATDLAGRVADDPKAWDQLRDYLAEREGLIAGGGKVQPFTAADQDALYKALVKVHVVKGSDIQYEDMIAALKDAGLTTSANNMQQAISITGLVKAGKKPYPIKDVAADGFRSDKWSFANTTRAQRIETGKAEVSRRVSTWAANSGDSHREALAMQMAVKAEFGVTGDPLVAFGQRTGTTRAQVEEYYASAGGWFRTFARAMYDHTQEEFAREGITHVAVYRGMSFGNPPPAWARHGAVGRPELMPMNSWTTSKSVAHRFAHGAAGNGGGSHRIIMETRVPVGQVIGSARTGFGCLSEYEFVVFDAPGTVSVQAAAR